MLLITDLDNTLYDWVTYFAASFRAMLDPLAKLTGTDEETLVQEFKRLHQHYGTSEQPFVALELPSVQRRFPGLSRQELLAEMNEPLHAFNRARRETLRLYPGVAETLAGLAAEGVVIVGHTEAMVANAFYRLQLLGIDKFFSRLYVPEHEWLGHPLPERGAALQPPDGFICEVPRQERKPNPALLYDICAREGATIGDALYVGDSITRDISMARRAGMQSAWARYGTTHAPGSWDTLVRITHWTDEDVEREAALNAEFGAAAPDFVLDEFSDVLVALDQIAAGGSM